MGNAKLIELIILYSYDKVILSAKELEKLEKDLASIWDYNGEDIIEILDDLIAGNEN